jgi:hypothetical protein
MCSVLEAPHPGRQRKQGLYKKNQYISWLTEEYMDMWLGAEERGQYIPRLHVTEEYI